MNKRIALVTGDFHKELAEEMIVFATQEATSQGAEIVSDVRVSGSYETPLVTDQLLQKMDIDAVVVLGYIERGETLHGEVMGYVVHGALQQMQLKYGKPVGIGIIGPGATSEQAQVRKEGAARGAVAAVLRSLTVLEQISDSQENIQSDEQ